MLILFLIAATVALFTSIGSQRVKDMPESLKTHVCSSVGRKDVFLDVADVNGGVRGSSLNSQGFSSPTIQRTKVKCMSRLTMIIVGGSHAALQVTSHPCGPIQCTTGCSSEMS